MTAKRTYGPIGRSWAISLLNANKPFIMGADSMFVEDVIRFLQTSNVSVARTPDKQSLFLWSWMDTDVPFVRLPPPRVVVWPERATPIRDYAYSTIAFIKQGAESIVAISSFATNHLSK